MTDETSQSLRGWLKEVAFKLNMPFMLRDGRDVPGVEGLVEGVGTGEHGGHVR